MRLTGEETAAVRMALEAYLASPGAAELPEEVRPVARGLGALPLYVDIGGALLLRPDGTLLEVHSNQSWADEVESRVLDGPRDLMLARVAAAHAWPALASLAPERPPGAVDCSTCDGTGRLALGDLKAYCRDCGGAGWASA